MEANKTGDFDNNLEEWNASLLKDRIAHIIIMTVLSAAGISGNVLTLVVYKLRLGTERRQRFFIPYLAIVDILACTITGLRSIIMSVMLVTFPHPVLCKILWFLIMVATSTSAIYLLVICVFRYRKICFLNTLEPKVSTLRGIMIGACCVIILMNIPTFFIYGEKKIESSFHGFNVTGTTCSAINMNPFGEKMKRLYFGLLMITSILIVMAMIVLYSRIGFVLYRTVFSKKNRPHLTEHSGLSDPNKTGTLTQMSHLRSSGHFNGPQNNISAELTETSYSLASEIRDERVLHKKRSRRTAKTNFTAMFFTIIALYIGTFIPCTVLILVISFKDERQYWLQLKGLELNVLYMISNFYIFHHVANPLVYLYFDMKFRKELSRLCAKLKFRC